MYFTTTPNPNLVLRETLTQQNPNLSKSPSQQNPNPSKTSAPAKSLPRQSPDPSKILTLGKPQPQQVGTCEQTDLLEFTIYRDKGQAFRPNFCMIFLKFEVF